jgi:L-lactate dehydrogenase complex protein LldG
MSSRAEFLERVRHAAQLGRPYRVPVAAVPERTGYIGAGSDVCQHFAEEVTAVGGQALRVADLQTAAEALRKLLIESAASRAICWQHDLLMRLGLTDMLHALNVQAFDYESLSAMPEAERRAAILACDVGITSCDCAIAETGTLMMWSAPGRERVASLVAPVHIAIVERPQIVPDLFDAFELLSARAAQEIPSNVTFITGPSKTGDIELQLTTGVHGPGKWQVIIVG